MLWIPDQKYKSMMTYSLTKTVLISISMFLQKSSYFGVFPEYQDGQDSDMQSNFR